MRTGFVQKLVPPYNMAERNRTTASLLDSEIERRTKIVKPFPKTVKP